MEVTGQWTKDEEGYMEFNTSQVQRLYEIITDEYHQIYNQYLETLDDEEEAHYRALADGYEMVTDYQEINGIAEFVTTYRTPGYIMDVWYETDKRTKKKIFTRGFLRINQK